MKRVLLAALLLLGGAAARALEECKAKRPIVAVHGIIAAQMWGKAKDIPQGLMPKYCARNFDRTQIWLNPAHWAPGLFQCFKAYLGRQWNNETLAWEPTPGITYDIPDWPSMKPIEVLESGKWGSKNTRVFADLVSNFTTRFGYVDGVDLLSPTYDWRDPANREWQQRAVRLIEEAVNRTGQRAVVIGHSMGGPYGYYLLQQQPKEWHQRYIEVYVPAGPAWMGAPTAVAAVFAGFDDLLPFLGMPFAKVARRIPALYALLPKAEAFPSDFVLLKTPSRSYRVGELLDALVEQGLPDAKERLRIATEPFEQWNNRYDGIPPYRVHQVYSTDYSTLGTLSFRNDFRYHPEGDEADWDPPTYHFTSGDGTVTATSLEYPLAKWSAAGADVRTTKVHIDHVNIVAHPEFIELIRSYACDDN